MGYRTDGRTHARTKTIFLVNGFKNPALRAGQNVGFAILPTPSPPHRFENNNNGDFSSATVRPSTKNFIVAIVRRLFATPSELSLTQAA